MIATLENQHERTSLVWIDDRTLVELERAPGTTVPMFIVTMTNGSAAWYTADEVREAWRELQYDIPAICITRSKCTINYLFIGRPLY